MPKKHTHVTQEHFDQSINEINKKLEKLDWIKDKIDWLVGKYEAHDQEHELLNHSVSEHSDNLEIIHQKLGIQV